MRPLAGERRAPELAARGLASLANAPLDLALQLARFQPAPGTEVARGSTVTVVVSSGPPPVVIPDLAGRPVLEAAAELTDLGFEVRIEGAVEGNVLGTRPQAGTSVRQGSNITVVSTIE